MKLMRYILAMSIAVIAAFGSGLQARAQPQTQSDDAILRLSGTSTAPLKTLRTGSLTIVDQDQVFIDTEGVQWTEGQLDGRAAVVGIVGERDGPESRYTIEVVDPVARIIRIQQRGRYISRMSYWSAFPQHKLSYYTYTDGPPNGYGNFKVTDAGNGRMTLQEDGVFVSRFCCVPGGPRDQNAVVASFENRASSGPPVRFRLIGRASSVVQSPAPQPQSPKILPQTYGAALDAGPNNPRAGLLPEPTRRVEQDCVATIMSKTLAVRDGKAVAVNRDQAITVCQGAVDPEYSAACVMTRLTTAEELQPALTRCSIYNQRHLARNNDHAEPFVVNNTGSTIYGVLLGNFTGEWSGSTYKSGIVIAPGTYKSISMSAADPKPGAGINYTEMVLFTDKNKASAFEGKALTRGLLDALNDFNSGLLDSQQKGIVNLVKTAGGKVGILTPNGVKVETEDGMFAVAAIVLGSGERYFTITGEGPTLKRHRSSSDALSAPYP